VPDEPTREALERWPRIFGETLFVYFIQAKEGGPVKVGKAVDPVARLRELQCANASELVIRAVIAAQQDTEHDPSVVGRGRACPWRVVRQRLRGHADRDGACGCEEQLEGVTQAT
jgi:hypothetical protein